MVASIAVFKDTLVVVIIAEVVTIIIVVVVVIVVVIVVFKTAEQSSVLNHSHLLLCTVYSVFTTHECMHARPHAYTHSIT